MSGTFLRLRFAWNVILELCKSPGRQTRLQARSAVDRHCTQRQTPRAFPDVARSHADGKSPDPRVHARQACIDTWHACTWQA